MISKIVFNFSDKSIKTIDNIPNTIIFRNKNNYVIFFSDLEKYVNNKDILNINHNFLQSIYNLFNKKLLNVEIYEDREKILSIENLNIFFGISDSNIRLEYGKNTIGEIVLIGDI